jgi:hypothetical protein
MTTEPDLFSADAPRLNKEQLRQIINTLRPDKRMNAGRKFFLYLLESDGVDGVYAFLDKARGLLDKSGELEIDDFDDENGERKAFERAREKTMTRRFVLGVIGEAFGGAALGTYGALGMADQATKLAQRESLIDTGYRGENGFDHARHRLDETIMPTAYTAIGSGMVYLAGKNYHTHRLSDIENAVQRLCERIAQKSDHTQRGGR